MFTPSPAAPLHALNLPVLPYRSPNLGPASAAGPGIEQNYLDAFTHANFPDNIEYGLDAGGRILGANGKRPIVRNIGRDMVEHFRRTVEVVDLIGVTDLASISQAVSACKARSPGPAAPWISTQSVPVISGYKPEKMVSDPAGYFIVYVDRPKRKLSLEHYQNTGVLDVIVEGTSATEIYIPVIERQLISRLDHAAYLGRELARAEFSLGTGEPYVQDAAPEARTSLPETGAPSTRTSSCGCGPEPKENEQ